MSRYLIQTHDKLPDNRLVREPESLGAKSVRPILKRSDNDQTNQRPKSIASSTYGQGKDRRKPQQF